MTRLRQACAGLLVSLMALALPAAVLADDTGSHIYDENAPISLTIHHYANMDGIATINGQGRELDPSELDPSLVPLDGVTYTVTQTHDKDGNAVSAGSAWTHSDVTANGIVTFAVNGSGVAMPHGTYTVTRTLPGNAQETSGEESFTVVLPMTDPVTGSEWIYDVHMYPKSTMKDESLTVTKELNGNKTTIASGEAVSWTITSSIPSGIADGQYFVIADPLAAQLTYVPDATVQINDGSIVPLTKGTDYNLYYTNDFNASDPADTALSAATGAGGTLVVIFTKAGMTKLGSYLDGTVEVILSTQIIVSGEGDIGPIINHGYVYYKNGQGTEEPGTTDPGPDPDPDPEPSIITNAIKVIKTDDDTTNPKLLQGAQFVLRRDNGGTYEYYINTNGVISWSTDISDATALSTGANGEATFLGLEDGTYELVETKAPQASDGRQYNLLQAAESVTVDSSTEVYIVSRTVQNSLGFLLPVTGGNGTLLFTALGLALITIAGVAYVVYRRKKATDQ